MAGKPTGKMYYFQLNAFKNGTACSRYLASKYLQHLSQRDKICAILGSSKLKLRKWCSSHPDLLKDIPKDDQTLYLEFSKFSDATIKTLGIVLNPKEDKLKGRATPYEQGTVTKKVVCPELAKICDPLDLCSITTALA